jgi:hypothetical protein
MQKRTKLRLSKDTIRSLVPSDLRMVGGGIKRSCGGDTACDCSGWSDPSGSTLSNTGGSGLDTVDMCGTLIAY